MRIEDGTDLTREEKLRASARKRRKRRSKVRAAMTLSGILVLLVAVMYGGLLLYTELTEPEETAGGDVQAVSANGQAVDGTAENGVMYTQEELEAQIAEAVARSQSEEADRVLEGIKEALSEGTTTVETLRPFYPDEIVVVSGGRFHFVPINRQLRQNTLDASCLNILENGEYQYMTDGQVTSHKGIDVSSHQGKIDWEAVAQDGVEFAFIRVGFRGYGTGKLVEDEMFEKNIEGAAAAGIKVGAYLFSQAVTSEELLEEADMVLRKLAPYRLDCPVVFDVEKVSGTARMNELSVEERTELTKLFCETVAAAGYKPMIYHNTEGGALMLDLTQLEEYDKWYACYSDQMFYPYEYKVWQYTDKGSVQGIETAVDMNISFAPVWND